MQEEILAKISQITTSGNYLNALGFSNDASRHALTKARQMQLLSRTLCWLWRENSKNFVIISDISFIRIRSPHFQSWTIQKSSAYIGTVNVIKLGFFFEFISFTRKTEVIEVNAIDLLMKRITSLISCQIAILYGCKCCQPIPRYHSRWTIRYPCHRQVIQQG